MARPGKKIPVGDRAGQLTGTPFGGLDLGELPAGPEDAADEMTVVPRIGGRVVLRREKSQRGGKVVIVAGGFDEAIADQRLEELARRARRSCGCGGTLRGREVELQGDHAGRVRDFFEGEGFRVDGER